MVVYKRPSSPTPPVQNPSLTLKAVDGTPAIKLKITDGSPDPINLSTSINGGTWTAYTVGDTINMSLNDTVAFSGTNTTFNEWRDSTNAYKFEVVNGTVDVYGELISLINFDQSNIHYQNMFQRLFMNDNNDSSIRHASGLILPLSACGGCYAYFFKNQTSLSTTPYLPAPIISDHTYYQMFHGCTNINSLSVAFTSWDEFNCTADWVVDVQTTSGTFYKPIALSEEFGRSRIPENWTVVNTDVPPVDYTPLTFTALENNSSIRLYEEHGDGPSAEAITLDYKVNNGSWSSYTVGDTIYVNANDTVAFSGTNDHFSNGYGDEGGRYKFNLEGTFNLSGNMMSLMNYDYTCTSWCFNGMFEGAPIADASNLNLGAIVLADWCYMGMFQSCSLSAAPQMPGIQLKTHCYDGTFRFCGNLISAQMAATSYASEAYSACQLMFNECSSLTSITVHITSWNDDYWSMNDWVDGVAAAGTFYCPSVLDTTIFDNSHVPSNWTVVNI